MKLSRRSLVSLLCTLPVLGAACAHAPEVTDGKPKAAREDKVYVTGSRIPRRVDRRTGQPEATSPVQIYSRDQLLGTGEQGDLGRALTTLEPDVSVSGERPRQGKGP